jgi:UDP-galactopyranose mutase
VGYDYVVVGAGFFGATFAQQMKEHGRSVLVIERRDHVGGNAYSADDPETGIDVHRYGTHVFHTRDEGAWHYINRFARFNQYHHRVLTNHRGKVYSLPVNLSTINGYFGVNLCPSEARDFLSRRCERIVEPKSFEEKAVSEMGRDLYESLFKGYSQKHWGRDPNELPANTAARLPVRYSYDDSYFVDPYQGVPIDGYAALFARLLTGIEVQLKTDFFVDAPTWRRKAKKLVYTGPLDRFYEFAHGRLGWRAVRFELETVCCADFQGTAVMNFADLEVPYTRIHEPRHLHPERCGPSDTTLIMREYPFEDAEEVSYPVNSAEDEPILRAYQKLAASESRVIFGGRLAQYKYYDMGQVLSSALRAAREELRL